MLSVGPLMIVVNVLVRPFPRKNCLAGDCMVITVTRGLTLRSLLWYFRMAGLATHHP